MSQKQKRVVKITVPGLVGIIVVIKMIGALYPEIGSIPQKIQEWNYVPDEEKSVTGLQL